MWRYCFLLLAASAKIWGKIESEPDDKENENDNQDTGESDGQDDGLDEGTLHIGAAVTQVTKHPYAATLLENEVYVCSAVILNTWWLITESKCFKTEAVSSYVNHRNLKNYTVRVGSSYNNKGGSMFKITTLINNFDLKISAMKLNAAMEFGSRVQSAKLPVYDQEPTLGYLATIIAWTPDGHMRIVNAPLIEPSICDGYTKLLPEHYICLGGVQDINRKFCRKDNGGAVIQNNTLIGVSSFLHPCAVYTRTHAFPKVSSFARWLDSVIWDEDNRPTTPPPPSTTSTAKNVPNVTRYSEDSTSYFGDPRKFMLTLPFDPINVPLEPSGDNSVLPRMSLYEAYLQSIARSKTSTTADPRTPKPFLKANAEKKNAMEKMRREKQERALKMMYSAKRFGYNGLQGLQLQDRR
ncbi:trypsin domain-containing protein [Phthorimaea operculella]|nr:trypsin domain-containing protein [Phthorimaea operculella]